MVRKPRVFESDPQVRPEPGVLDIVGRFRAGRVVGRTPVTLDTWRVTTADRAVAAAVAAALGGSVEEWDIQGEDNLEVLTDADSVRVLLTGAHAIESDLKLWSIGGVIIHHCDGTEFLANDRKGEPCGCPESLADRKDRAKAGRGPRPDTSITFRLLDVPGLGRFQMRSGSWDLLRMLHEYVSDLEGVGGPAVCTLRLETITFTPKRGPMLGKIVSYKKPALKVEGPYEGTSEPV
jgi:hypothetical protein